MSHKILVVDDQALVRNLFRKTLEASGYTVYTAEHGKFGWEAAKKEKYDLILTDLNMPYINGMDMITLIRDGSTNADTTIIMISSDATADRKLKAKEVGANGWITKPVQKDQLLKLVQHILK